jgi:hypothetical protein
MMPAGSQKQQKFMGLVLAYKRGEVPASKVSKNVKQVAASMSEKELEKFAGTKHKGLPKKAEGVELEEAMTLGGVKLSAKAQEEVKKYNLQNNQEYIKRLEMYADSYSKRKPTGTAAKNMLRALRMMTYKNTPDDWARLHATEYFMRKRTESVEIKEAPIMNVPDKGAKWTYKDARGVEKVGYFVKSIEGQGSDIAYEFKDEQGKADIVRGQSLKDASPVRESIDQSTVKKIRERIEKTVRSLMREGEGVDGGEEKKEPTLTPEQKALYTELIRKYNQYGESIYREGRLRETYKNIKKIVEFASKNIVDESGDWFDGVTLSRHSRKMNESFKIFEKTVMEITKLQQRLESVYEEIGETLSRYYEIEDDGKNEPMVTETDGEGIFYAFWNQQRHEIKAKDAYAAKLAAIEKFKIPKSKQGLLAIMSKRAYDDQEFRFR